MDLLDSILHYCFFAYLRIRNLKNFSTYTYTINNNNQTVPENESGKKRTLGFFSCLYGASLVIFGLLLLNTWKITDQWQLISLAAFAVLFLFSQNKAYKLQRLEDSQGKPHIGIILLLPSLRLIPMFLIMNSGFVWTACLKKTSADIVLDYFDRKLAKLGASDAFLRSLNSSDVSSVSGCAQ